MTGTATGWSAGQALAVGYTTWLLWSALSRLVPSQQLGKFTCRRSSWPRTAGQAGGVDEDAIPLATPQFQYVTRMSCGPVAFESPAIILKPGGNGWTRGSVFR